MKKLLAFRKTIIAALMALSVLGAALAVAPVQAAMPGVARLTEKTETAAMKSSFDFVVLYSADTAKPAAADIPAVNIVIMRNGKAVAHANNLKWGQRFEVSLAKGTYKVEEFSRATGKLMDTFNLAHETLQKDSDLLVVFRLPWNGEVTRQTIRYGVMAQ